MCAGGNTEAVQHNGIMMHIKCNETKHSHLLMKTRKTTENLIKGNKGNQKKFCSLMKKLQTNKVEVRELVIDNGNTVTACDVEASQVLCNHF